MASRHLLRALCVFSALLAAGSARAATDLRITLTVAVQGASVTYTAQACGEGQKSGPFAVGLYYDRTTAPTCPDTPNFEWSSSGLGGGSCTTLTHVRTGTPGGSYTAWVLIDRTCVVQEFKENNNTQSKPYRVGSELSVSSFSAKVSGTTVTYAIDIKNTGLAIAAPFTVGLYFDRTQAPSCSTTPDQVLTVATLDQNQTTTQSHVRTGVSSGSCRAWIMADQGCAVSELNETDNIASSTYEVGPNLYLLAPVVTVSGSSVTYSVDVCDWYSSAALSSFAVSLWYDLATAPACGATGASHVWNEPGLPPGQCKTLTHQRTAVPAGSYQVQVMADAACSVAESREDDNARSKTYVVGSGGAVDLYLSDFSAVSSGTSVTYRVMVCNQGTSTSPASSVGLFFHRTSAPACGATADFSWNVPAMSSSTCQTLTHTRTGVADGAYTAWAMADPGCTVGEATETNNAASADYAVGQPDVSVASFSASRAGTQVTYDALICDGGVAVGSPFSVGFYYDRAVEPTCSDAPDLVVPVSNLGAGACQPVSAVQSNAGTGTRKAWVFADNLCQVTEGNESNNRKSYSFTLGGDAPDLRVTNFTVTADGGVVTFVATVCNSGAAPSSASDLGIFYDRTSAPQCGDGPDWAATLPTLAPGDCETATHKRTGAPSGTFKAWARTDAGCTVGESDESNNTAGHSYTVAGDVWDLEVTAIGASVSGGRVIFLATLCNLGGKRTPGVSAALYYDREAAPGCEGTPDMSAALAAFEPGQCVNQSWVRDAARPGTYTAWVLGDSLCTLAEQNEANNAISTRYTVQATTDAQPSDGGDLTGPPRPDSGCGCRVSSHDLPVALVLPPALLLLGLGWLRRRRRATQR